MGSWDGYGMGWLGRKGCWVLKGGGAVERILDGVAWLAGSHCYRAVIH